MTNIYNPIDPQPIIVKYVQQARNGVQAHNFSRNCIGYVLKGKKFIHDGDLRYEIAQGDVFYLAAGNHYTEDIPEAGKDFEQILFYFNNDLLNQVLSNLSMNYQLTIENDHSCHDCNQTNHVICSGWATIRNFFSTVNQYFKEDLFGDNLPAQKLKMTELIYLIITLPDCCIKNKLVNNIDLGQEQFEQIIQSHIFSDIGIEGLAHKCNRSLTSFKKEFYRHFYTSPHKWFIKQRLIQSRLLLISTNKLVSEIGMDCNFPNTSHFIKLFKKEYNMTPANYRQKMKIDAQRGDTTTKVSIDSFLINNTPENFA